MRCQHTQYKMFGNIYVPNKVEAVAEVMFYEITDPRCYLVEALVTVWTFVAFLCVVRLKMSHLGGGVGESLVAEVTVIRLLTAVHQLVALQVARCGEKLATHVTAVTCFTRVSFAVQVEKADLAVALSTSRAAVWLQRARKQQQHNLRHKPDRAYSSACERSLDK